MSTSDIQPPQVREQLKLALELREYMTPEEQADLDRLLWSPVAEVKRYRRDPVAFATEVLHMDLAPYQEQVLIELRDTKRVTFRGPRGAGKSTIAAAAILWFLSCFEECQIPTTTSNWRQLIEFLWPEIHKWAMQADWWRVGLRVRPGKELMSLRIELTKTRKAFAMSSNNQSRIEGAHAPAVLMVFDEAKIIPEGLWDSAEGSLGTSEDAYFLALSTPGDSVGRFFDIQTKRDRYKNWSVVVATIEQCVAAGRILQKWVDDCKQNWGEKSVMFVRHVLGNFYDDTGDSLISLSSVERAQQRWELLWERVDQLKRSGVDEDEAEGLVWGPLSHLAIDPARFGQDKTGWAHRHGDHIKKVDRTEKEDTMQTTGRGVQLLQNNQALVKVDVNGLGAGVFDRFRELHDMGQLRKPKDQRLPAIPVNTANATKNRDKTKQLVFNRLRDYLWWNMRELLEGEDSEIALPPDEELAADLVCFKWTTTSTGKVMVESKDDVKKRLGRSPDTGDAVVIAYAPDAPPYKPMFGLI